MLRFRAVVLAVLASSVLSACASRGRTCRPCEPAAAIAAAAPTAPAAAIAPPPAETPEAIAARRAQAVAMMDAARARTAYLPLKDEEATRKALPSMKNFPRVPNLIRIAAARPKTMEAEMKAWEALRKERTIDRKLVGELFWVVSKGNECGHCMGHIAFETELAGAPLEKTLDIGAESRLDPMRRATFAFARKVSRDPHSVTPADVDSLRPYFKDDQIVELILTICRYDTMNTLAEAFGSPLETINVFDPKNAPKKPAADAKPESKDGAAAPPTATESGTGAEKPTDAPPEADPARESAPAPTK